MISHFPVNYFNGYVDVFDVSLSLHITVKFRIGLTTVVSSNEKDTLEIFERLDVMVASAGMLFKPRKSRSLSLRKGKVDKAVTFNIANQVIPTMSVKPVKSIGRWYDASLKETKQGKETVRTTEEGLETIDNCDIHGKHKA